MFMICEIDPTTNQSFQSFAAVELPEEGLPENQYVIPEDQLEGCGVYTLVDGEVQALSAEVFEAQQTALLTASIAVDVRNNRNQRLTACDWVVISAIESGESVDPYWAAYRQELRDISELPNFPFLEESDWPVAP
jgi:hypothetical protein